MDERRAQLERRVAEAFDAWLSDPRDTGVWARLVSAAMARRRYLQPELPDDPPVPIPAVEQPDELLDELGAGDVVRLGEVLEDEPDASPPPPSAGRH